MRTQNFSQKNSSVVSNTNARSSSSLIRGTIPRFSSGLLRTTRARSCHDKTLDHVLFRALIFASLLIAQSVDAGISPALPRFDKFNSKANRYFVYNGEKYKITNRPQIFMIGDKKFEYFHETENVQPGEAPKQAQKVSSEEFLAASKLYRISNFVSYLKDFETRLLKSTSLAARTQDFFEKECARTPARPAYSKICPQLNQEGFFDQVEAYLLSSAQSRESNWEGLTPEKKLEAVFLVKQDFEKSLRAGELFFDSQFKRADNAKAGIFDPGIESQDVYYPDFVLHAEREWMKSYVAEAIHGVPKSQIENDIYLYAVYLKTQMLIGRVAQD